ncbi:hypothetical protein RUM43_011863, partial [Polyplax serrata]
MENREKLTVDVEQEKHKQYRRNEAEMKEERKLITSHMQYFVDESKDTKMRARFCNISKNFRQ